METTLPGEISIELTLVLALKGVRTPLSRKACRAEVLTEAKAQKQEKARQV